MPKIVVNGITWGHSRGITPLLAAAQRFSELYPEIEFIWKKRSLQEFADYPIEKLVTHYDLLVIDHPWVGTAAATLGVLPLDQYISKHYLAEQATNSVGASHSSYHYGGHQWALAIDAAAPAASYRADLLQREGVAVPKTWEDVLALAKLGKVAVPAIPIDLLMNFYTFCIIHGNAPFKTEDEVIDRATGLKALETMREFYSLVDKKMFSCNPIAVAELMSSEDDYWYCPFAYSYSNYARKGYSEFRLKYGELVTFANGQRLRGTIGGTGLAVSAYSSHREEALLFAEMVASSDFQAQFYVQNGGQPGHRLAWLDEDANYITDNFFHDLLPSMDNSFLRPRYSGHLYFQDRAGTPLQDFLQYGGDAGKVLDTMNNLYQHSLYDLPALNPSL